MSRVTSHSVLRPNLQIVLAALIGTLVQSLFVDSTHWRHLWLLLALAWAITVAIDRDITREQYDNYVK